MFNLKDLFILYIIYINLTCTLIIVFDVGGLTVSAMRIQVLVI